MTRPDTLDTKKYGHIISLADTGMAATGIADILSLSPATVSRVIQAEKAAKDGDREMLKKLSGASASIVKMACQKYNVELTAPAKQESVSDNTATAFLALLEAVNELTETVKEQTKAIREIDQRLTAMQMTQQGARKEANEHHTKLVETININGDIQTKEQLEIKERLEAIKNNTKSIRKGWRDNNEAL